MILDVYVNIRRTGRHTLLAICDIDILGKTLRDKGITFKVNEEFYKGVKMDIEEAIRLIEQSTIVNMVGQRIVERAMKEGYVHPEAVLVISGVPHAQIMKIQRSVW